MGAKKKEVYSKIEVIASIKELNKTSLNAEQQAYAKTKIAEQGDYVIFDGLGEITSVILAKKRQDYKGIEKLRKVGATICKKLNESKVANVLVKAVSKNDDALYIVEGMALANYQFLKYFSDRKAKSNSLENILVEEGNISSEKTEHMWAVVEAVLKARDLVNEPQSYLSAPQFSEEMQEIGKYAGFKVTVLDQLKVESLKMGGLLAVNKGSLTPCTFNILEYKPKKAKNAKPIVLVGKGVVYDTGGLSLKPTPNSMDIMKSDMGGAATVVGTMQAIAKAGLNVHVIGLIPATDNRPSGNAYAPGDVIKMYDGTTVEVLNTDAEGRMILADALAYAKKYNPELVIDFATLTGAAVRAIGSLATVVMGNAEEGVFDKLSVAGDSTYERLARMPFYEEYAEEMKSKIADLKNIGGPYAGQITAGKFLEHFTGYPWVHMDIAGPAWVEAPKDYHTFGGSGVGIRLMFEYLKNY
ncbi:MAG: leucyl aminopeptidase [Flavobacteriales bacterium]|nr:leucyl aminopeptidase [Flavobacteriales bacterium]